MHLTINRKTHYDVTYFPADRMVGSIKYQISFEKCRQIIFLTEFQRPTVFPWEGKRYTPTLPQY